VGSQLTGPSAWPARVPPVAGSPLALGGPAWEAVVWSALFRQNETTRLDTLDLFQISEFYLVAVHVFGIDPPKHILPCRLDFL
jgi:hypothetical protein